MHLSALEAGCSRRQHAPTASRRPPWPAPTSRSWILKTPSLPRTRRRPAPRHSITWRVTPNRWRAPCAAHQRTRHSDGHFRPGRAARIKGCPDFLVLPKTETAGHLQILDRLLTAAGKDARLIGLIESARGLAALKTIAAAIPRLVGLMLGAADMAADLGAATARLRPWPADRSLCSRRPDADRCAFLRHSRRRRAEAGGHRRSGVRLPRQGRDPPRSNSGD